MNDSNTSNNPDNSNNLENSNNVNNSSNSNDTNNLNNDNNSIHENLLSFILNSTDTNNLNENNQDNENNDNNNNNNNSNEIINTNEINNGQTNPSTKHENDQNVYTKFCLKLIEIGESKTKEVIGLLNARGKFIDLLKIIPLIPGQTPLVELKSFLEQITVDLLNEKRKDSIQIALLLKTGQYINAKDIVYLNIIILFLIKII